MTKKSKKMSSEEESILDEMFETHADVGGLYSIPFRHLGLQKITNGVKSGYLVEIRGQSQAGKSFLLYELMAECEKLGGYNLLFDLEHALEDSYKDTVGITNKRTKVSYQTVIEKLVPTARKFIKAVRSKNKKCPIIVGVDSWPRIKTKEVVDILDDGEEREFKQTQAMRNNNVIFDQLTPLLNALAEQNVVFVILNQLRENHLIMFGDKTTSRGNAILQFECHLRLDGRIKTKIKNEVPSLTGKKEIIVGTTTEWKTIKNRGVKPHQTVTTRLIYTKGINKFSGLEELLLNDGTVEAAPKVEPKKDDNKKKEAARKVVSKTKKDPKPEDYKFRMLKTEAAEWFDDIKGLIESHPEALKPLITGEYSTNEDNLIEEVVSSDEE